MPTQHLSLEDAAALVRPTDALAIPLGPGQPTSFLHALAGRDSYDDLQIFGALLVDLYEVFLRPGVHYTSGFFGPAERFLRDRRHVLKVVFDPRGEAPLKFKVRAMPTTFLLDKRGNIRFVHEGFTGKDVALYQRRIEALLAEAP